MELGCRVFVATSNTRVLKNLGVRGQSLRFAIKAASEAAEKQPVALDEEARPLLGLEVAGREDTEGGVSCGLINKIPLDNPSVSAFHQQCFFRHKKTLL